MKQTIIAGGKESLNKDEVGPSQDRQEAQTNRIQEIKPTVSLGHITSSLKAADRYTCMITAVNGVNLVPLQIYSSVGTSSAL